jgi:hypothetical protein
MSSLVSEFEGLSLGEGDKVFDVRFEGGDAVRDFLRMIVEARDRMGIGGDAELMSSFAVGQTKGEVLITIDTWLPRVLYMCNVRVRAAGGTFVPFALPTRDVVAALGEEGGSSPIVSLSAYRSAPSLVVVGNSSIPMRAPTERDLPREMRLDTTGYAVSLARTDLTKITTTAQLLGSAVNFRVYLAADGAKAVFEAKLAAPRDGVDVGVAYTYTMRVVLEGERKVLIAENAKLAQAQVKSVDPDVDVTFGAEVLQTLTRVPSGMDDDVVHMLLGGRTYEESRLRSSLYMAAMESNVEFEVFIMPDL